MFEQLGEIIWDIIIVGLMLYLNLVTFGIIKANEKLNKFKEASNTHKGLMVLGLILISGRLIFKLL